MSRSSSGDVFCSSTHKYILTSISSHSFILSASHIMRNSEESFPIHTFSALMFTRSFFTYYISCFSPGQKNPSHLLILHIKENDHCLNLDWFFLYVWGYKTTNLLLLTCNLPDHPGLIWEPLIKQLFHCTFFLKYA